MQIETARLESCPQIHIIDTHKAHSQKIEAYAGATGTHIDDETNKKLFWAVNKRILACMLGTYFCQSLDKGTLGFASVMNIKADANLQGQEYR